MKGSVFPRLVPWMLLWSISFLPAQETNRRYALVIGNSAYQHVDQLVNPANDAADIAAKLRSLGFQVDLRLNALNADMGRAIADYTRQLSVNNNNEGFFWYAGHGLQINGENYLLPVDIDAQDDVAVMYNSYPLNRLLLSLEQNARNKLNVVVLDACRDNPFRNLSGGRRGISRGLGTVEHPPQDLFIMFSTAPGTVAADGEQGKRNSPFAEAFLKYMDSTEILPVMASLVARETLQLTGGKQRPFQNGSIVSDIYYSLNPQTPSRTTSIPAPAPSQPAETLRLNTLSAQVPERPAPVPENFVRIAGGTFMMGSPGSEPGRDDDNEIQHRVNIGDFYLKAREVTVGEFREFVSASGYATTAETSGGGEVLNFRTNTWEIRADANWKNPRIEQRDNHPVVMVSWFDAVNYCNWLSAREGLSPAYVINGTRVSRNRNAQSGTAGYRLPTEAEWEYACRAGNSAAYTTGGALSAEQANYNGKLNSNNPNGLYRERTTPVGSFAPNAWGLYDMHGNVWEWCWDWNGDYPVGPLAQDPAGPELGTERINRGGAWSSSARSLRSAYRSFNTPVTNGNNLGFRIARSAE
ncbi:SUMF1/EgtB/PvdO family nonheme iron enzyme [Treponema primitia]|uniref:SUMF1/EgtB/PvdO family nonheme iron enzyme n=1 Tax=Treponema primitia TaxID=88058 RepID=UPI00397EBD04